MDVFLNQLALLAATLPTAHIAATARKKWRSIRGVACRGTERQPAKRKKASPMAPWLPTIMFGIELRSESSQLPRRRHPFSGQSLLLLVRGPTGRLTRLEAAETLIYFTCLSFSLSNSRRLHTFLVTVRSKHGFKSSEMCKTKCVYFLGLNPSDETAGAFGVELSSLVVNASSFIRALFSSNEQGRGNQQKLRVHESYCI